MFSYSCLSLGVGMCSRQKKAHCNIWLLVTIVNCITIITRTGIIVFTLHFFPTIKVLLHSIKTAHHTFAFSI